MSQTLISRRDRRSRGNGTALRQKQNCLIFMSLCVTSLLSASGRTSTTCLSLMTSFLSKTSRFPSPKNFASDVTWMFQELTMVLHLQTISSGPCHMTQNSWDQDCKGSTSVPNSCVRGTGLPLPNHGQGQRTGARMWLQMPQGPCEQNVMWRMTLTTGTNRNTGGERLRQVHSDSCPTI